MKTNYRLCASVLRTKKVDAEQKKFGMTCSYSYDDDSKDEANLAVVEFGLEYAYSDKHQKAICDLVRGAIKSVGNLQIQSVQKVLFIGVGNPTFTADCFGVCVSKNLYSKLYLSNQTESTKFKFYYFNPDIRAKTGLDTIAITNLIIDEVSPDIIFLFDCYATRHNSRVGKVVEVKNKALRPASAVEGYDDKIVSKTGAKIISIGAVLLRVSKNEQMLSMKTNADLLTMRLAESVADAVSAVLSEL
ncbi:MAG: GPR endopeptidase [Christensenellales bacterium]